VLGRAVLGLLRCSGECAGGTEEEVVVVVEVVEVEVGVAVEVEGEECVVEREGGMVGEQLRCDECTAAAEAEDGGEEAAESGVGRGSGVLASPSAASVVVTS
jgi:hypothetical protein